MITHIKGLHHVTSMAAHAQQNSDFFTKNLGLRRVKKTVNFDDPQVYHLYYGDEFGTPGSVMTYFPFPHIAPGRPGTGEVGDTYFAVPRGALKFWKDRLVAQEVSGLDESEVFGEKRLRFDGPDRDSFSLIEVDNDSRSGWQSGDIATSEAIQGFRGASLRLQDSAATSELLRFMGYQQVDSQGNHSRFAKAAAMAPISSTSKPYSRPTQRGQAPVPCITSPLRWKTGQRSLRYARRCWTPAIRSRR